MGWILFWCLGKKWFDWLMWHPKLEDIRVDVNYKKGTDDTVLQICRFQENKHVSYNTWDVRLIEKNRH